MKKIITLIMTLAMILAFSGCGDGGEKSKDAEKTEVIVFAAASMKSALEEIKESYEKENPEIKITLNCDSSGTLMEQILEGAPCDIFFSAAGQQMDKVDEEGLMVKGSRQDVLNNQLVVITHPDSKTAVTGIEDLNKAKSLALADGSVPVGKYTRRALMNKGVLNKVEDPSVYTTKQVSEALGGVEISEQGNVSKVLSAVQEASSEVGTVYLSDTYGHKKDIKILQKVTYDIAGDIIYPIALIENKNASDEEKAAAKKVLKAFTNDDAVKVYNEHLFDTDLKKK